MKSTKLIVSSDDTKDDINLQGENVVVLVIQVQEKQCALIRLLSLDTV